MTHGKIQIQGDSMYPTICDQDWLDIEYFRSPRDLSQFQEGEVLLVRECDQWQIHRAIEINQKMHCKGDWANSEDGPSMAWGQVVAVNGKAHSLLKDPWVSQLSRQVHHRQRSWKRKCFRALLLIYVQSQKAWRFLG